MSILEKRGAEQSQGREDRRERRRWSPEDKRRIVAESFESGASVSLVARRHDLNTNTLFTWRREAKRAATPMLEAGSTFSKRAVMALLPPVPCMCWVGSR